MAQVNPRITAQIIDVDRFPELGRKYRVGPIPRAIINERVDFTGAAPEDVVLDKVMSLNSP